MHASVAPCIGGIRSRYDDGVAIGAAFDRFVGGRGISGHLGYLGGHAKTG